ncbi:probable RNA 3'-terminal phosphate cyclase-like protein [Chironomus tepperi]|uniref:probable RNA 3'-terminal phosphate cyclase-like protein n=1 Tax=Chironomus tepperi TaxID=113505 RepID=UPI00391EE635
MAELTFKGSNYLKQKLILATISGKAIKITDIRSNNGGLQEFEINLIRLIDKLTDGSKIKLHATELEYVPGILLGGKIEHQCCVDKSIGFYLDVLIAFGPFCKHPIEANLKGVTNSPDSPSVDHYRTSAFNIMKRFVIEDDSFELKVFKRGMKPLGGGEILFKIKPVMKLRTLQLENSGMVKRIRGIVYSCKVSPTFANRTVEAAKGTMLNFLPDVYIHTDQNKGKLSGLSPGFGVNLSAETTENVIYAAEVVSNVQGTLPEDIGKECANKLLDEIYRGGCCDSTFQWIMILYMALSPKNVSKAVIGPLSQYSIKFLQLLKEFLGITFKLDTYEEEADEDETDDNMRSPKVVLACVGVGYSNLARRVL